MKDFYYIVKGATKGDNVGEVKDQTEEAALKQLEQIYDAKTHGLTLTILSKSEYNSEKKRIDAVKLAEAEAVDSE